MSDDQWGLGVYQIIVVVSPGHAKKLRLEAVDPLPSALPAGRFERRRRGKIK